MCRGGQHVCKVQGKERPICGQGRMACFAQGRLILREARCYFPAPCGLIWLRAFGPSHWAHQGATSLPPIAVRGACSDKPRRHEGPMHGALPQECLISTSEPQQQQMRVFISRARSEVLPVFKCSWQSTPSALHVPEHAVKYCMYSQYSSIHGTVQQPAPGAFGNMGSGLRRMILICPRLVQQGLPHRPTCVR